MARNVGPATECHGRGAVPHAWALPHSTVRPVSYGHAGPASPGYCERGTSFLAWWRMGAEDSEQQGENRVAGVST